LAFCDLRCFDAHVPVLNHRDAGAFEKTAPLEGSSEDSSRKLAKDQKLPTTMAPLSFRKETMEQEILVVASKVKAFIRSRSHMNTSDAVMEILSQWVRDIADRAIERAKKENRKTILERDI
jgi:histone H3/H4